ncbi:MAG: ATP-dependent RecD-like DNA helicase [Oscillospiraceae bacterium]
MEQERDLIEISGTVDSVIFQNEENGYTVLKVESTDGMSFNAVGCLPFAAPGEQLILFGEWTCHATHGEQFKVEWAERIMPSGAGAIYEYLASRVIKGIGPATASLIVNQFGDKALEVIERSPKKLTEIRGISLKRAKAMSNSLRRQVGMRRLMEFLYQHGIEPQVAMRLYRFYGDTALELVEENPYILCSELIGATFSEADTLALNLGMEETSAPRIAAAVVFELRHNAGNGHCFIPRDKLAAATAQLIAVESELIQAQIANLIEAGNIVSQSVAGCDACYLASLHEAECYVADWLLRMSSDTKENLVNLDALVERIQNEQGIRYAERQRDTIAAAARRQVLVLTGGPGTGKTTCVRAVLSLFEKMGLETYLAAPTGRAAKRMSELTGKEAYTVHRLLETGYSAGGELVFRRDETDPLRCDAVILDECSMVDITLMRALLAALPPECRLVLVGDADQLPSVGPGNVFLDIIRSEIIDTVRLTEIFRQSGESDIVRNAHMINRGEHPMLNGNKNGFFFLRRKDPAAAVDTILELCAKRLPENMAMPITDIQVLSPTRRGEQGTTNLNKRLQETLNPPDEKKREKRFGDIIFREGDRVMQIRNNYDIIWRKADNSASGAGVFNGDIGYILAIDPNEERMLVDFDGRYAAYAFDMLAELEHAFAMTVHKSQGSEYRAVVMSACRGAPMLLSRSVLYTAVTRARELLIIVGDDDVVNYMIDNHRQTRRYSGLRARLAGEVTPS